LQALCRTPHIRQDLLRSWSTAGPLEAGVSVGDLGFRIFGTVLRRRKLIEWYRAGLDVGRELPKLATYLGHVDVAHTYWYLEAVPELLQLATDRLGAHRLEINNERLQLSVSGSALLHRPFAHTTGCESNTL
jgi:hypothetical protein